MFDFQNFDSGNDDSSNGDYSWSAAVKSYEIHLYKGKSDKYFLTEYGDYDTARKLADNINEKFGFAILDAVAALKQQIFNKNKC